MHALRVRVATVCMLYAWQFHTSLFHAWYTTNYTRRVYSTPRQNVVHANMYWEYLKIYRGATRVHVCKNEVIIERYHTSFT